jgi:hypothetical protein
VTPQEHDQVLEEALMSLAAIVMLATLFPF